MYNSQPILIFVMGSLSHTHTLFCTLCCYTVGLRLNLPESRGVCLIITCQRAVRQRAPGVKSVTGRRVVGNIEWLPCQKVCGPARVCIILPVCECVEFVCVHRCVVCAHIYFCLSLGVRWMGCGGSFWVWVTREQGEREGGRGGSLPTRQILVKRCSSPGVSCQTSLRGKWEKVHFVTHIQWIKLILSL